MVKATEAEVSRLLVPSMDQTLKRHILHFPQCNSEVYVIKPYLTGKCLHASNSTLSFCNAGYLLKMRVSKLTQP